MPRTVVSVSGVFIPGWGAHAGIYRGAVPAGWEILEPPSFVASGATVAAYRRWIVERCGARPGPFTLAGHSFGAVLAVHAALAEGVEVECLVLVGPSALPLEKPVPLMFWDFSRRVAAGWFPPREAARAVRQVLFHPLLARRLGMEVRAIDLSEELEQLRDRGLPCTVVAASTDTLTPPIALPAGRRALRQRLPRDRRSGRPPLVPARPRPARERACGRRRLSRRSSAEWMRLNSLVRSRWLGHGATTGRCTQRHWSGSLSTSFS